MAESKTSYTNRNLLLHLFTVSLMVHYGFTNEFYPWQFLTTLFASIYLLYRPVSIALPLLAVFVTLADYIFIYPEISNHAVLQFFICLGIVILALFAVFKAESSFFSASQKTALFRVIVFLIYFFSGFHKLNYGFLDSDQSCVNELNMYVSSVLNKGDGLPLSVIRLMQLLTIFIELLVPFGLLWQRTTKWSVYVLFLLHGYLFMAGFAHFASVSLVLLPGCLIDFKSSFLAKNIRDKIKPYILIAAMASIFCFVGCHFFDLRYDGSKLSLFFFICCGIYFVAFIFGIRLFTSSQPTSFSFKQLISPKLVLPITFIFLWGMEPYYGLSNRANMSMYSNLITMQGRDNHLLINTKYTKLIPFEEDSVRILEISSNLKKYIGNDYRYYHYPVITFRRRASIWVKAIDEPVYVKLIYRSDTIKITNLKQSIWAKSFWHDRYFYYRPTPVKGYGVCVW